MLYAIYVMPVSRKLDSRSTEEARNVAVPDETTLREVMRDLGIRMEDVADRCGVDRSYASKQLRGERPMARCVRIAFLAALDEKTTAALPHVARLLRRHGEGEAAEACERLWERLVGDDALDAPESRPTQPISSGTAV